MQVKYKEFVFETDTMRAFATGVESMPTIFVNQNGLCFLEQSRKSWKASRIKHLPANEARRYADTFQLHELKAYLAAVRTPSFA